MKQQHILLLFSTIILVGSLILLIDDAPKGNDDWTYCFTKDFRDNQSNYSITMNFLFEENNLKNTLQFSSDLQNIDAVEDFPIKTQSIEHALRTLRELEIHTEEYDNSNLEQFGLGTASKLEIILSKENNNSISLKIGNDTHVGYSTYINCNGKVTRSRNTVSQGIPTSLISYKNLFTFRYSLPQIKSFQIDDSIIEEIDGVWWQSEPLRTQLQREKVETFFSDLFDLKGNDVQPINTDTPSPLIHSGSILLHDQDIAIPFKIANQKDNSIQIQHRNFDYTYERDDILVLLDFQNNINELYSTSLHHQMSNVSKIELKFDQISLQSEKIPNEDELQTIIWNDDGKLYDYVSNKLILKRMPNWKEAESRENSCAPDVNSLGFIRLFIENRFFEYPICQVTDTVYLTSSFEDGMIQVMSEPDKLLQELQSIKK